MDECCILDSGSGYTKLGSSRFPEPQCVAPTILGLELEFCETLKRYNCGNLLRERAEFSTFRYPLESCVIRDEEALTGLWLYLFHCEICVDPSETNLVVSDQKFQTELNRQKAAELLFEALQVPALRFGDSAGFSLFAAGRTTGLVVDVGHGLVTTTPVYDGRCEPSSRLISEFGGRELERQLQSVLMKKGLSLIKSSDYFTLQKLKEKALFCRTRNLEREKKSFQLPDGSNVDLDLERFELCEGLFQHHLVDENQVAIQTLVYNSVKACSIDTRKDLLRNVLVCGGTSDLPNFRQRMDEELRELFPQLGNQIRINTCGSRVDFPYSEYFPETSDSVTAIWRGGKIFSELDNNFISRADWQERGRY